MSDKQIYTCDPECWVEAYSDELFRYAFARIGNRNEAEDIVQDTFFAALKNLDNFRRDCSEKTWLYNILKNKIIDHYRKQAARSKLSVESEDVSDFYGVFFESNGSWNDTQMPKPWQKLADQDLNDEEFLRILAFCMDQLPALWASVFSLKNMDDKTSDEICKELDITSSNLWVVIHRAKLQLRGCIDKNWFNK